MVNQVLQDYIRGVNRSLRHLPPELRKRLVAEITGHIILDVAAMRREDPTIDQQVATDRAIKSFCPPEELRIAYGPDGGVVRSSTGETVLRSRSLSEGAASHVSKTFVLNGAAAAGWVSVFAVLGVMAFVFLPGLFTGEDLEPQAVDERVLFDVSFQNLTGNQSLLFPVEADGEFEVTVLVNTTGGCAKVDLYAPGQSPVGGPRSCAPQTFSFVTDATGQWRLDLHAEDFTGRIVITAIDA